MKPGVIEPASVPVEDTNFPREATEDEISSLTHVTDSIPFRAWVVVIAAASERFTYFGVIAPWQNYMQNANGSRAVPGALGLGQATATNISNAFLLVSFLTPLLFAVISDMWLGRFKTLIVGLGCYVIGCLALTLTSLPQALDNGAGVPGLSVALVFVALGSGSVKATVAPFIGDQYEQSKPQVTKRDDGTLVIVDGARTLQFLYNVYYWLTNVASLSIIAITFLEKEVGFWASYALPTAFLAAPVGILLVFAGKLVKIQPQQGNNTLSKAARIISCAAASGFKLEHAKPAHQVSVGHENLDWDDKEVDDVKMALFACRVLLSLPIFYLCINEIFNNLVSQAGQMQLGGVPNDFIQVFSAVACIILGPLIQTLFEFLAKYRIHYGPIARITTAFVFCGLAMAYSAGLQKMIYSSGPCYEQPLACAASDGGRVSNDLSVWAQVPVYFLLGVAEILGFVAVYQYSYEQAPASMKSMVQAIGQLTACLASGLGMAISPAAKDPNLVIMYSCLAGAAGISAVLFWLYFNKQDGKAVSVDKGSDSSTDNREGK